MLFLRREDGQGQTEYALLLVLMAISLLFLLTFFGQEVIRVYERIRTELSVLGA
jgi:Flp pilus assembly pilin Flp